MEFLMNNNEQNKLTSGDWVNVVIAAVLFGTALSLPVVGLSGNLWAGVAVGISGAMMLGWRMTQRLRTQLAEEGPQQTTIARQYMRRFGIALLGYMGMLAIAVYVVNTFAGDVWWRYGVAVLPVLPVAYGVWGYMQFLRSLDEFQQRIQLEAIGFSLGMTSLVTMTIGFLEVVGLPMIGFIWVFPMIIAFWGIGQVIAQRRYQ